MATKISANPTRRLSVRSEVDYGWRYTVIGWSLESGHICDEKHLEKIVRYIQLFENDYVGLCSGCKR